jgi:shikimate kinase
MARPVFITGMMGSGKSTVGRLVADATRAAFVDLDARITRIFGVSVEALFADGEARFRECERVALEALANEPGVCDGAVVVATGGGVVTDPRNLATMHRVGTTVYLDVPVPELAARLESGGGRGRPLLDGGRENVEARLQDLLAARREAYASCRLLVDGRGGPQAVADRVLAALETAADDRSPS